MNYRRFFLAVLLIFGLSALYGQVVFEDYLIYDQNESSSVNDFLNGKTPLVAANNYKARSVSGSVSASQDFLYDDDGNEIIALKFSGNTGSKASGSFYCIQTDIVKENGFFLGGKILSFKVLGDGNSYKVEIENTSKTNATGDGCAYTYQFSTKKDQIITISVPLSRFRWQSWSVSGKVTNENVDIFRICLNQDAVTANQDFSASFYDFKMISK